MRLSNWKNAAGRNRKRLATLPASLMFLGALMATPVAAFQTDAATKAAMDKRAAARTLLSSALTRIGTNGNNAAALLDAGRASMALDDYRAALGFLLRAEQNAPRDGAVKAALGTAMLHQENPRRALDYYGEAQLLKTPERLFVADRALAYDLLGQQEAAQRDYALALSQQQDDEILRRYALSLGISGQPDRAIEYLTPLLAAQDRSAWRTRAMILAMNGRQAEAKSIVDATMPKELATNIWPYLEQMDRLTPAQLAEAAHFGRFPSGALGPKRAPVQAAAATPAQTSATDSRNTRTSRGTTQQTSRSRTGNSSVVPRTGVQTAANAVAQPAVLQPAPAQVAPVRTAPEQTAPVQAASAQVRTPQPVVSAPPAARPAPSPVMSASASTVRDTTAAAATARSRVQSIVEAQTPGAQNNAVSAATPAVQSRPAVVAAVPPAPSPAVRAPEPAKPLAAMASLGDIIGSLQIPANELVRSDEAVSADTLAGLRAERRRAEQAAAAERAAKARADAAAKAKADAEAKAKAEAAAKAREEAEKRRANPSRIWVQIGSGSNAGALSFTFDRYAKKHSGLFGSVKGGHSDWGRTRRLLAGPFNNRAAAQKFLDDFKKAEGDGFIFSSAVGEEVEMLK